MRAGSAFSGGDAAEIRAAFEAIQKNPLEPNESAWRNLGFIGTEVSDAIVGRFGSRDDAREIAQDILAALFKKAMSSQRGIAEYPPTFFKRCIRYASYRFLRQHRRDPLGRNRMELDKCTDLPTSATDSQREFIRELWPRLPEVLAHIGNHIDRQIFLEHLRGITNVSVASRFHLSEASAWRRRSKVVKALRQVAQVRG
jgi:DNA-directed RNA polymerase specialized sigma24 family protein